MGYVYTLLAKNIPMQRDSTFMGKSRRSGESDEIELDSGTGFATPVVHISSSDSTSTGFRRLKNRARKKTNILKDTFNNSNCASSQVSENGKTLAATYYSNERPWGGMPALYRVNLDSRLRRILEKKTKAT